MYEQIESQDNDKIYKYPDDKLDIFYKRKIWQLEFAKLCGDWDILIILKDINLVIDIEAKNGSTLDKLKEASDQTKKRFSTFQYIFGNILSPGWQYVSAVCIPNLESNDNNILSPCNSCRQFMIEEKHLEHISDMKRWIQSLINFQTPNCEEDYSQKYENILAGLIGYMSICEAGKFNKLIVDPIVHSKETSKLLVSEEESDLTGENDTVRRNYHLEEKMRNENPTLSEEDLKDKIFEELKKEKILSFMLNHEQLKAVMNTNDYIVLSGDFCTGKTFVLKESQALRRKEYKINYCIYQFDKSRFG